MYKEKIQVVNNGDLSSLINYYNERYPVLINKISENLDCLGDGEISLDIDAVTQATYSEALLWASHKLGKYIRKDQLLTYWELGTIAQKNGISIEDTYEFTRQAFNQDRVFRKSKVIYGIKSLLAVLTAAKRKYLFSSARPPFYEGVT